MKGLKSELDEQYYDWAIVIFYYSVYHAASALISSENLSSKSHMATICCLIRLYYHMDEVDIGLVTIPFKARYRATRRSLGRKPVMVWASLSDIAKRISRQISKEGLSWP